MRIYLILDPKLGPQRLLELGQFAERHGIEGVWTSSLLGCHDPFVAFTPLAMASQKLHMGPIAINPFDTHPARIATALLTLNEISNGRAQIVIGGGAEQLEGLGIKPERRVTAVRECVELIQQAATDKRCDYVGKIYKATGFGCEWAKSAPPRVWIGANGPQMLAMAGEVADGIMMSDLPQPALGEAIASAKAARAAHNPNAAPMEFSNFVAWHVYQDVDKARKEARSWLAYRGLNRRWVCTNFMSDAEFDLIEANMPGLYKMAHGGPVVEALSADLYDRIIDNLTLTAHPSDLSPVIEHIEGMRQGGLTQVALRLYQDVEQSIELIGDKLVPHFA